MASRVVDILLQQGRDAAAARLASGEAVAGAVSNIGQIFGGLPQQNELFKEQQLRRTAVQQQVDAVSRAQRMGDTANQLTQTAMTANADGVMTFDRNKLQGLFAQHGIPIEQQQKNFKLLDDIEASADKANTARTDFLADLAHGTQQQIQAGADPHDALAFSLALAKGNRHLHDADVQQIQDAVAKGIPIPSLLANMKGQSEKYKSKPVVIPQGGTLATEEGTTIARGQPKPPTETEVAQRAAAGDPEAQKAMSLLKPQTTPTDLAIRAAGGDETAKRALELSKTPVQAPTAVAHETELERQGRERLGLERQRLTAEITKMSTEGPKTQERLEQEARALIAKEFNSRSGDLGRENQRVTQAIHLLELDKQFQGKPMPAQIYAELALGVANLTSPGGQVGIELEREFKQRTAAEGLSKGVAWLTGDPTFVNATPQKMRDMLRDSITRQGTVAERNRERYFKTMQAAFPTDLSADRREALGKALDFVPKLSDWNPGPEAGTVKNGATWKKGAKGWGWYK